MPPLLAISGLQEPRTDSQVPAIIYNNPRMASSKGSNGVGGRRDWGYRVCVCAWEIVEDCVGISGYFLGNSHSIPSIPSILRIKHFHLRRRMACWRRFIKRAENDACLAHSGTLRFTGHLRLSFIVWVAMWQCGYVAMWLWVAEIHRDAPLKLSFRFKANILIQNQLTEQRESALKSIC